MNEISDIAQRFLPKCIQVTLGAGEPLTLQSNRAARPSMTSKMSSLRVNKGSLDGVTLRFALEVNSSVKAIIHPLLRVSEFSLMLILASVLNGMYQLKMKKKWWLIHKFLVTFHHISMKLVNM